MGLMRRVRTISSWTLASRMLGLVRDRLLAGTFGGSLTWAVCRFSIAQFAAEFVW